MHEVVAAARRLLDTLAAGKVGPEARAAEKHLADALGRWYAAPGYVRIPGRNT